MKNIPIIGTARPELKDSTPILDGATKARAIFEKNVDTHIAMFLIKHPDVDPADVEIVFTPGAGGKIKFSIEPRELHVPPARKVESLQTPDGEAAYTDEFSNGWNACRDAMIAQAKMVRAPEAMVSTLAESMPNG